MTADINESTRKKLFEPVSTGSTLQDIGMRQTLLEQYKLYVDMANSVSMRRERANALAMSMNTGLALLIGYFSGHDNPAIPHETFWVVAVAGIILNWVWSQLLRGYRDLNTAKFTVVHYIEEKLVISPFRAEWEAVERGGNSDLYHPLTHVEVWIPRVFCAIYVVVGIQLFPWTGNIF